VLYQGRMVSVSTDVAFRYDWWAIGIVQTDALSYHGRTRLFPHLPVAPSRTTSWRFPDNDRPFVPTIPFPCHTFRAINHVRDRLTKGIGRKSSRPAGSGTSPHTHIDATNNVRNNTFWPRFLSWSAKRYDDPTCLTFDPITLSHTVRDYFEFLSLVVRSQTRKRLRTPHFRFLRPSPPINRSNHHHHHHETRQHQHRLLPSFRGSPGGAAPSGHGARRDGGRRRPPGRRRIVVVRGASPHNRRGRSPGPSVSNRTGSPPDQHCQDTP
jgi:hypothetical protein